MRKGALRKEMGKGNMTWNEFKAQVDKILKEQGLTGDEQIDYIDVGAFVPGDLEIACDSDGLAIRD